MVADGFTKALGPTKVAQFVHHLGMCRNGDPGFRESEEVVNQEHDGWHWWRGKGKKNL